MSALTKVLEEARVLQIRNGVTSREALAMAMARQRRAGHLSETIPPKHLPDMAIFGGQQEPVQLQMPAASCLDALLPRDREPTIAEIRDAWKECMEQASLIGEMER